MKIDICTETFTTRKVCKDLVYCCDKMKEMVDSKFIEFDTHYPNNTLINLRDSYSVTSYYYQMGDAERIPYINAISIKYCPFCGEKIE